MQQEHDRAFPGFYPGPLAAVDDFAAGLDLVRHSELLGVTNARIIDYPCLQRFLSMTMTRKPGKPRQAAGQKFAPADIRPEQSIELLKELHILTREGQLNQDSRRKLKQVYHLYQLVEPLLAQVVEERGDLVLVDHGAGKSYLGFILYDLFLKAREYGQIVGVERRGELVSQSQALAQRLGFSRMAFINLSVEHASSSPELPVQVDVVTALHACDTATDEALRFALDKRAQFVVLVPCCQAEIAAELRRNKSEALATGALAELWRHPIHTREFGSMVTNVLRCLLLEEHGYQVSVTELTGWEHSLKNELIIARRTGNRRGNARERLDQLLTDLKLEALAGRFASCRE
jgi:hypothetical protein